MWALLRPSLPRLIFAALLAVLSGGASLVAIWAMVQLVASVQRSWAFVAIGAWLVAAALQSASSWLAHATEAHFEARVRRAIGGHILRLDAHRLASYPTDQLRRLVSADVAALHHMLAHLPAEIATLAVIPLAGAILLVALAGPLALIALLPGALAAVVYLTVIPKRSARHGAARAEVMQQITTAVDTYARGIAIFRLSGASSGALADYRNAAKRFTAGMTAWVRQVATPAAIAVGLLQAAASYALAYLVGGTSDLPRLTAIVLLSLALVTPALRLGHGLDYVAAGRAAAKRIGELLAEPTLPAGSTLPEGNLAVRAEQIGVRAGEHWPLADVSLHAPAGQVTAITGPSGAGKTTLLHVIAGLQPIDRGSVQIGETPVGEIVETSRCEVALLIGQGADALSASVRENLQLTASADDASYRAALTRAALSVDLAADASTLSGGERQRLALARAFLSPAPVVLLDEPTSALDHHTAQRVWDELAQLAHSEGKTIIVVTHDVGLAQHADQHVVIKGAK